MLVILNQLNNIMDVLDYNTIMDRMKIQGNNEPSASLQRDDVGRFGERCNVESSVSACRRRLDEIYQVVR